MMKKTSSTLNAEDDKKNSEFRSVLNEALKVFFTDALKTTLRNPIQAFHFFRTIRWQMKAARVRSRWEKQGVPVPPILIFSITNKCNLDCKGCYQKEFHPSTEQELSGAKLREITHEAHKLGIYFFVIAGGEPLIRPEMLEITQEYPEIIFLVFTNGTLIDDAMVKQLKKQKNVVPLISLEGDAEDTNERRGEGTYQHVLKIMGQLRKNSTFFGTSIILTRPNFATVTAPQFIQDLAEVGCKFFLFLDYTPTQEGTEDWVLLDDQRMQVMSLIKSFREQFSALFIGVPWDEMDVGGCLSAGRGFVHVNAEGDVEPCPFAPISDKNLKDVSLKEALQSEFLQRIREIPELSKYTGGGCALWKNRERVRSLFQQR
ncbi:MAG: radical SAM protein [Candidatus Aminicenantes bacterium]|nr:MAG: radical SAM protein [Candidatus Aminicenantes bacterium]